jgi:aspartate aminotransferase-like enzyme
MLRLGRYHFKRAETTEELEQVHRLNYRTFVQEIPEHADNREGRLVDKYHDRNVYFLAVVDGRVVGMISVHDRTPFLIESRLIDRTVIGKPGMKPLEVRLLAIEQEERHSMVIGGLTYCMNLYAREKGYTHYLISGVTEQLALYKHIGFEALGPAKGPPGAVFIPMIATLDRVDQQMKRTISLWERKVAREAAASVEPVSMLPGPVPLAPEVRAAFAEAPIYHRGTEFVDRFEHVREALCRLTKARSVAMTVGSGTLANESIAAALVAGREPDNGLVLVNGEFGRRILKQVNRFGANPRPLEWPWGQPWDLDQVAIALDRMPPGGWVWGVHQESSTGVMNDLHGLIKLATKRGVRVCADCVSSLGAVPLDLNDIYLASGATGKALSSYAGLSLVFADPNALSDLDVERVPSYFDLPASLASAGPRFTVPSPLLVALETAMHVYDTPDKTHARYDHYAELGRYVRDRLRKIGLPPLADESVASPVITSFYPPDEESSNDFVDRCQTWGFLIGGQSGYLAEQRLVQIANMGTICRADLDRLFERLEHWMTQRKRRQLF